jgi:hypothetical protein
MLALKRGTMVGVRRKQVRRREMMKPGKACRSTLSGGSRRKLRGSSSGKCNTSRMVRTVAAVMEKNENVRSCSRRSRRRKKKKS